MKNSIVSILFLLLIVSCSKQEAQQELKPVNFLDAEVQEVKKREFAGSELKLEFEKDLEELGIYSLPSFVETEDNFVLVDNSELVIKHLNKTDLTTISSFKIQKGRGPKELEFIMSFDASEDLIAVADNRLMKIILVDHEGNLVNEFTTERKPSRLNIAPNGNLNLLFFLTFVNMESTLIYNLTQDGDVNYIFENEDYTDMHAFDISGSIKTIGDTLYYVGAYAPFIKKYVNGDLISSRATIDNYDSSINYITVISGETRSTSLSPHAMFSSNDFDVKGERIFIVPNSNGDPEFSFIDIYNSSDGSYIKSYRTIDVAGNINVYEDERSILTIEKVGELGRLVFRKYSY
tara:strand:+ start:4836 stop:5879 length:1044 start_codon:yes stop_codon:yes gene_type:complete